MARHVAVNLPVGEGRVVPMNVSRLRDAGVRLADGSESPAAGRLPDPVIAVEDSRLEQRQKLWKIIAATALVVLLLETLVAGLRRRAGAESPTA